MEKLHKFLSVRSFKDFDDMVKYIDFLVENSLIRSDIYDKVDCIELFKGLSNESVY